MFSVENVSIEEDCGSNEVGFQLQSQADRRAENKAGCYVQTRNVTMHLH